MIDESELIEHVKHQRWYGAKSRDVAHAQVVDQLARVGQETHLASPSSPGLVSWNQ